MKGFSGKVYDIKACDVITHPDFYGHKNIEFTITKYDIACGEVVRNSGDGGRVIDLDVCEIKRSIC